MTVHINKTKRFFIVNRNNNLFLLKQMHLTLMRGRRGFDDNLYQRMRKLTSELKPFTSDEESSILIEIERNKRD